MAGVMICLVNAFIGSILRLLTLPLNWMTLGLVSFIISVFMIQLASSIVPGFSTGGFFGTALFALVLSGVNMLLGIKKK
ncbi:MAG: phage holin family protein [bacterium]|nr:phage holin family protein [bacterium]